MKQITIEEFIKVEGSKKMICCSLTEGYHWLRISEGHTPTDFREKIDFKLGGYEYLYVGTADKDGILDAFDGAVKFLSYMTARKEVLQ